MNTEFATTGTFSLADLAPVGGIPLLLNVQASGTNATIWADEHKQDVQNLLKTNGALLIRGLNVPGSSQFGKILATLFGGELVEYVYRSTPRT
jgi:hypothetical protein